jgi:soluble lytic murein transglycosylase
MKHKILAQLLLLICLVVSCSEVPVEVYRDADSADASTDDNPNDISLSKKSISDISQASITFTVASNEQRAAFLNAEQLFLQRDTTAFLTQLQQLKDYPLYPYLQAKWLKKNLAQSAEIETFVTAYQDNYHADELRRDWLFLLAKNQQWAKFNQYYHPETDSKKPALQCYAAWAQYHIGQQEQALNTTQELWLKGVSQAACNELFAAFSRSSRFNEELVWQRFSSILRAKKPNLPLATQLKSYLSAEAQKSADLWLKLHQHPASINQIKQWDTQAPKTGDIFAHTIARLTEHDFSTAVRLWDAQKSSFTISQSASDEVLQKIGVFFAKAGYDSYAYSYLIQAENLEENARHTLVRVALKEQDWQRVNQALTKLTAEEKNQNKWRYWQARAWAEIGNNKQARETFAMLSKNADFYALLSADKLNQPYRVTHVPVPVTAADLKALQQHEGFKGAAEWLMLGRKDEGLKQWWFNIKNSSPQQIMAAAKLAQAWQIPKLAAFTLAKADYWHDLELRFPIAFTQEINTHALKHNLEPSIVFGLIRQESVFDEYAGSSVGARGLMQIMPATGRHIAKQLQEPWHSDQVLYEPDTNIRYGTFYFRQLLDKFNGQVALAAAGYNAGPGRIKQWLPNKPMAMDVWIETIPFNETRQYVGFVLANSIFYQQRMNRNVLKITDFMNDVHPTMQFGQLSMNAK